jgi:hypothetical protein
MEVFGYKTMRHTWRSCDDACVQDKQTPYNGCIHCVYVVSIHGNAYAVQNESMVDIYFDSIEDNALGSGCVCAPFICIKY